MGADDPRTDAELIAAVERDWPDSAGLLGVLYERHKAWVLGVASRYCGGDRHAAMDAVQETFIALLGRFPGFELRGRLTTFLYPVARNAAITAARRRRLAGRAAVEPAGVEEDGPSSETFGPLRDAVGDLPEGQREVLLLRIVDGLSVGEVAMALGVPTGTVKSRLHKAIERLRADARTTAYFARR